MDAAARPPLSSPPAVAYGQLIRLRHTLTGTLLCVDRKEHAVAQKDCFKVAPLPPPPSPPPIPPSHGPPPARPQRSVSDGGPYFAFQNSPSLHLVIHSVASSDQRDLPLALQSLSHRAPWREAPPPPSSVYPPPFPSLRPRRRRRRCCWCRRTRCTRTGSPPSSSAPATTSATRATPCAPSPLLTASPQMPSVYVGLPPRRLYRGQWFLLGAQRLTVHLIPTNAQPNALTGPAASGARPGPNGLMGAQVRFSDQVTLFANLDSRRGAQRYLHIAPSRCHRRKGGGRGRGGISQNGSREHRRGKEYSCSWLTSKRVTPSVVLFRGRGISQKCKRSLKK